MRRDLLVFFCFAVLLGSSVLTAETPGETEVPVFPNLVLTSLDGQSKVQLESFRGRPTLVTFWASWCGPCRQELPEFEKLYGELAGLGFVLLTINVDDSPKLAHWFLEQTGVNVPVYRVDRTTLVELGVSALPTNILLDRDGKPVLIHYGYSPQVPGEIRRLVVGMEAAGADEKPSEE